MKKHKKSKKIKHRRQKKEPLLEKSAETALYFGFQSIKTPEIEKGDVTLSKHVRKGSEDTPEEVLELQEKIRILRLYFEEMRAYPQHLFFFYKKSNHGKALKRAPGSNDYVLDILGSSKGITEALIIQTAVSVLSEEGFTELVVAINSMGDRESTVQLEKNLTAYYRKKIENIPAVCRQSFKKDIFDIVRGKDEKCEETMKDAPTSLASLSDLARVHFKEVLESVEALGISYIIDPHLYGNPLYASHTVFEIRGKNESGKELVLGSGYCYNHLAKKIGIKKDIPAMGITLSWKKDKKSVGKKAQKPRFYFIQLGSAAKLKSLGVIELLRKAGIMVSHSLTRDKYVGQAGTAENLKFPYILIFGQKEAIENTIVVRDARTRFQDTIPLSYLATYLKKLPS